MCRQVKQAALEAGLTFKSQDMSIVEPILGIRIFNPVLVWYSQLTSDLANHGELSGFLVSSNVK